MAKQAQDKKKKVVYINQALDSSCIHDVVWNSLEQTLAVYFQDGSYSEYEGVPLSVVKRLIGSGSVGAYFNYNIRNNY